MPRKIGDLVFFELPELAEKLGCHINTLRRYLRQGRIKGRKIGAKWLVSEDALREYFCPPEDVDANFELWSDDAMTLNEDKAK